MRDARREENPVYSRRPRGGCLFPIQRFLWRAGYKGAPLCSLPSFSLYRYFSTKSGGNPGTITRLDFGTPSFVFQNDTMQVVWQYHVEEPVSAAGVLPDHGAVRGSRPLYLVQRDAQPKRISRNQDTETPLKIWDILNKQVSSPSHAFSPKFASPSANCKEGSN